LPSFQSIFYPDIAVPQILDPIATFGSGFPAFYNVQDTTMDDEDEFVDAVEGRDDENIEDTDGQSENEIEDDEGGFGDDDFGDFADEEDDEVHEEYDPEVEENTRNLEAARISEHSQQTPPSPGISKPPIVPSLNILTQKLLDITGKNREQVRQEALDILKQFDPPSDPEPEPSDTTPSTERLDNERAMSLWNQLAAPVPLNPPDWKRSRIRRLFLVSLGIPVNLDEILPASGKKKKLVLPNTKPETPKPTLSGKLPPLAPPFDPVSARHQSSVSSLALQNMTVDELQEHIATLKVVNSSASDSLTYWLARREEAVGEKESLEGVIESLVGWTERQRKGTTGIAMVPGRGKTPPPQNVKKGRKK
jgi:hypothetical protein